MASRESGLGGGFARRAEQRVGGRGDATRALRGNAAWLRLSVIAHNALTALERFALSKSWLRARPKRLRFQIFCSAGEMLHHARQVLLRVSRLRDNSRSGVASLETVAVARLIAPGILNPSLL